MVGGGGGQIEREREVCWNSPTPTILPILFYVLLVGLFKPGGNDWCVETKQKKKGRTKQTKQKIITPHCFSAPLPNPKPAPLSPKPALINAVMSSSLSTAAAEHAARAFDAAVAAGDRAALARALAPHAVLHADGVSLRREVVGRGAVVAYFGRFFERCVWCGWVWV